MQKGASSSGVCSPEVSGERGGCPGLSSQRQAWGVSAHTAEKYCRRVHFDQMPWSKSLSKGEGNPLRQLHPQDVLHFSRGPGGWQHCLGQGSRMWLVCRPWNAWDMLHEMQLEKAQRCPQQGWEVPRDLNLFSSSGHSRCVRVCVGCTCTCD